MIHERIAKLGNQIDELLRGNVPVAARADGARVFTPDSSPVSRAIRLVLSELRKEVPYDSCSVQELRGSRLAIIGGVGFSDLDVILGESFDIDSIDIPNGQVVFQRRTINVSDTEQFRAFRRGLHVGAGIRSWMGTPLIHDDRLFGILALDKAEPDFYNEEHERLAAAFSSLLARALASASAAEEEFYA